MKCEYRLEIEDYNTVHRATGCPYHIEFFDDLEGIRKRARSLRRKGFKVVDPACWLRVFRPTPDEHIRYFGVCRKGDVRICLEKRNVVYTEGFEGMKAWFVRYRRARDVDWVFFDNGADKGLGEVIVTYPDGRTESYFIYRD